MPVSGLVLTLREDVRERDQALALIGTEPRITVGVMDANRLAVVLDTISADEDRDLRSWLDSLPGVTFVEVAFVGFEQSDT